MQTAITNQLRDSLEAAAVGFVPLALLILMRILVGRGATRLRSWFDTPAVGTEPTSLDEIDRCERRYYWQIAGLTLLAELLGVVAMLIVLMPYLTRIPQPYQHDAAFQVRLALMFYVVLGGSSTALLVLDARSFGRMDILLRSDDQP
jgi:hypothetical protein